MSIRIQAYLPSDATAARRAALTPVTDTLAGSMILQIAAEVNAIKAQGRAVSNFTVGDFSPAHFRIPDDLAERLQQAITDGETNYPPSEGIPALREAISELYDRELGLDYGPAGVCVASGARPPLYGTWRLFVGRGERSVSFLPSWNTSYYAHLVEADHLYVRTTAETNFFPTVEQVREAIRGARLVVLNSPLNPTGTAISEEVLRGIAQAIVEENRGRERSCILLYDQVYWMLTAEGVPHHNPVALVPECAPYVMQVDAISKSFAATGLRVGWSVSPPYLQEPMKALLGHIGAWAPRPEQVAVAWYLRQPERVHDFMRRMRAEVNERLARLYDGIMRLKAQGLPVDAISPQGAIYLSFRVDLIGRKGFPTNESIRRFLLEEAGVAVVPFQAFDQPEDDGWFRMSVGAVGISDIDGAIERLESLLRSRL